MSQVQVYNSLSRQQEAVETREPGKIGIYVCGMTVYDYCHIGHARAMLTFDMVVRYLRHRGFEVHYVRNHTDVDDKIIARAAEQNRDPLELSAFFIEELETDLDSLGMIVPDVAPKVSDHIPEIVEMVTTLVEKGHAYEANGSVYFTVKSFPGYGKLSGKKLDDLIAGERVAIDPEKKDPADFALWKATGEGEISWESPWGPGRPGWHIECSAMSCKHLGPTFDMHGGGIDLVFPHHENEIAQSEGANGLPFARYWLHNGHVTFGTEKMSKSLGNIVRIRDIVEQVPAETLRLLYLEAHYRSPLPYSTERLAESVSSLNRIYQAKEAALAIWRRSVPHSPEELISEWGKEAADFWEKATSFPERFDSAMDADFNSAKAIGELFELVRTVNRLAQDKRIRKRGSPLMKPVLDAFALCGEVLGIGGRDPEAFFDELKLKRLAAQGLDPSEVEALIAQRSQARTDKDWARADEIRDTLDEMKILVMDSAEGSTWRVRVD